MSLDDAGAHDSDILRGKNHEKCVIYSSRRRQLLLSMFMCLNGQISHVYDFVIVKYDLR